MDGHRTLNLGRLIGVPIAAIGVLAAVLTWELEHFGSLAIGISIFAGGIVVCLVIARRVRERIEEVSSHYEKLLATAEQESRRAEAANTLKDEFLWTLSHELRTPLNSVLGWARLLASGKLDQAQTAKAVQAIERAGVGQARLIEDLLDVSRIVSGKLEIVRKPTAMPPLIRAAIHAITPAADAKRIVIDTDIDPAVPAIAADPDRVQQVVWNLLSNAIKFTPPDGHVRVGLTSNERDLRITVSDTGIGFSPEVAAHMFERFRQGDSSTTRQYGGLGLGLGIVRSIVELHGGTVEAQSAGEGRGSVFIVCLPILAAGDVPAAPAPPPAHMLAGVSVLVVDDDPQALEFVRTVLEQYDASVALASSAREAIEHFQHDKVDVVISDVLMPGESGLELIRRIRAIDRERRHRTPAVALTALSRDDDRRRALAAGYQLHVVKPIDPYELARVVDELAHPRDGDGAKHRVA